MAKAMGNFLSTEGLGQLRSNFEEATTVTAGSEEFQNYGSKQTEV